VPAKPKETRAWQLFNQLAYTPTNRRVIAQAFIEDEGDIPAEVVHSFAMTAQGVEDAAAVDEMVRTMRAEHFARLGKPVPKCRIEYR